MTTTKHLSHAIRLRVILAGVGFQLLLQSGLSAPGDTLPVSEGIPGMGPIGSSRGQTISADGRYVAFDSEAPDLVPNDTNDASDVFVYDRQQNTITRVSVSTAGVQGNSISHQGAISENGRYIVFASYSNTLVSDQFFGHWGIYIRDTLLNTTERVTYSLTSSIPQGASSSPRVSNDGRHVVFSSLASNLVAGDTNGVEDIFVRDRLLGTNTLVSIDSSGSLSNGQSMDPRISADGRYIAFESFSTNLVENDTNATQDIFVRDLSLGITRRANLSAAGQQANGHTSLSHLTPSGTYVVFSSSASNLIATDMNNSGDLFIKNLESSDIKLVTQAFNGSGANSGDHFGTCSASGRYVGFYSTSSNLVPFDTNQSGDAFLRDMELGTTTLVSRPYASNFTASARIVTLSSDSSSLAFSSQSDFIQSGDINEKEDIFVRDLTSSSSSNRISRAFSGPVLGNLSSSYSQLSDDGRFVAFASHSSNLVSGDTNQFVDVFLRDMDTGTTSRVSVNNAGDESFGDSPSISGTGQKVAFLSYANNLNPPPANGHVHVYVRDISQGTTTRASISSSGQQANQSCFRPDFSGDGRSLAFDSPATNLAPNGTGTHSVFVRHLANGTTTRASESSSGVPANGTSLSAKLSANGRYVVFASTASNLITNDTNGLQDIYLKDLVTGAVHLVSVTPSGGPANSTSDNPTISGDGRFIAFNSYASNLVEGSPANVSSVYVRDMLLSTTAAVSVDASGLRLRADTGRQSISADGRFIAFSELYQSGGVVFVRDTVLRTTITVTLNAQRQAANGNSQSNSISADGRFVSFASYATSLTSHSKSSLVTDIFRNEVLSPLSGNVIFEDFLGSNQSKTLFFQLRRMNGILVNSGDVSVGPGGEFYIPRPLPGSYRLAIKQRTFLRNSVSVLVDETTGSVGTISLANGDIDGNNIVDVADYVLLARAFDSIPTSVNWNGNADLNGDMLIGIADYLILAQNFDMVGDE